MASVADPSCAEARLAAFCAESGAVAVEPLAGGSLSVVWKVTFADGQSVVAKTVRTPFAELRAEARWLGRHRSAPQVLAVDANFEVLVMSYVPFPLLDGAGLRVDLGAEVAWLEAALAASEPAVGDESDVRDRWHLAASTVWADEKLAGTGDEDRSRAWLVWADGLRSERWRCIPFDVLTKNTLVDAASGRWWAIDPMCVLAPSSYVWCPWAVHRSFAHGGEQLDPVAVQEAFVARAPDPRVAAALMPGALLWAMSWTKPESGHLDQVRAALTWWLDRWEAHSTLFG